MRDGAEAIADRPRAWRWRLVIVALAVGVLAAGLTAAALLVPIGPSELIAGTVQDVETAPLGRYSSGPLVYVRLGSQTVAVRGLPGGCAVGDPILIRRRRMLLGYAMVAVSCGSMQGPFQADAGDPATDVGETT